MDFSFNLLWEHCPETWQKYQACLLNASKPQECGSELSDLHSCADSKVPLVRTLREQCRTSFKPLQSCLLENPHTLPSVSCPSVLDTFLKCLETSLPNIDTSSLQTLDSS